MSATLVTQSGGSFSATALSGNGAGITALTRSAISAGTPSQVVVNDGSGLLSSAAQLAAALGGTGINSSAATGVAKIASGTWSASAIVNADVSSSAAIARSKLASGTASQVVVNDPSGVMTSEAQLAPARGGTGVNSSLYTGVAKVSTGVWSASTIVDSDVNASAAIARSKLAAGTAGHVVVNNGTTGVMTSEAQLNIARGGTGQDFSGVGAGPYVAQIASGTFSAVAAGSSATAGTYVLRDVYGGAAFGPLTTPAISAISDLNLSSGTGVVNIAGAVLTYTPSVIPGGRVYRYAINGPVTGAAFTTLWYHATTAGTSYAVYARLTGIDVTGGVATVAVSFQYRAKNIGGTLTKVADQNTTVSSDSPLDATVARGAVSGVSLLVEVQGATARTVNWCGSIDVIEQSV